MKKKKWICLLLSALLGVGTALPQQSKESPVEKVKKIGDKLIRETPFAYKLGLASCRFWTYLWGGTRSCGLCLYTAVVST